MLISIVIPAYNAAYTIKRTIDSIFNNITNVDWSYEVIVVDDGSDDGAELLNVVESYSLVKLLHHSKNLGMCSARNSGIKNSNGDYIFILDSDDELISGWTSILKDIISEWPETSNLCYSACINQFGKVTASNTEYEGLLTLDDFLNERCVGEYMPIFRGNYVRDKLYIDLGTRKSCGIISYINYIMDAPFWVTNRVLRIYHDSQPSSVTSKWTSPEKAKETVCCYRALFDNYNEIYRIRAPKSYCSKQLKLAIYLKLAGYPGVWGTFLKGASFRVWYETIGAGLLLIMDTRTTGFFIKTLKRIGFVKRYG